MIKIGDLANICKVSVKTIRFYEKEKLLMPVEADRWTGYRYYDETSIKRLSEILFLKKLGFSLKEIQTFNETQITAKTIQIKDQICKLNSHLSALNSLSKNFKGELDMKAFVNDEKVIGKWQKVGIVNSKEDFEQNKIVKDNEIFPFPELYFMPNGEKYWVISWTKGFVFVKDVKNPYEIVNGCMLIGVTDRKTGHISDYAVYKQADNKIYNPQDIAIKDNTDIPFITDKDVVGFYKAVDLVREPSKFDPQNKSWKGELMFTKMTIEPYGVAQLFSANDVLTVNWSKGVIINKKFETASAYTIKTINNIKYMIMEWKSGDYKFGGQINAYYVFEKQNENI